MPFSYQLTRDCQGLQAIIADNLKRATRDNDMIYLDPVTSSANLPAIAPAAMVKATVPPEIENPISYLFAGPGGLGKPLFETLVPYGVHLAISIYDDRKDQLVRNQLGSRADELDALATRYVSALLCCEDHRLTLEQR